MRPLIYRFLLASFFATGVAAAASISYEGFDYPPASSIFLQNGGTGWSGPWNTPGGLDATVAPSTLTFGSLATSGGSLSTAGFQPPNQGSSVATWVRLLSTSLGADNTTAYLSFLFRPDAGFGFYGGLNFGNAFAGLSGNQTHFGLEGPGNSVSLSSVAATGQTVLFVIRMDFLPGNDRLSLFLNPTPGLPEPGAADVSRSDLDLGSVNSVTINNYGGFTTDEIRIGDSWESVTPTNAPEPALGAAAAFALAAFAGLARRRAKA